MIHKYSTVDIEQLNFNQISAGEEPPYDLLLLADPSKQMIDAYLGTSTIFVATAAARVIGCIVLCQINEAEVAIKNVAVLPVLQGKGVGKYLIENAIRQAGALQYRKISIGTANSSIGQLYLYQKLGFEITGIKHDFFITHYPNEIYENGIRAKHMIVLTQQL
jgi:ribosomal protein S18 acetylase RimI-like enzyme